MSSAPSPQDVRSYLGGRWVTPTFDAAHPGVTVLDPTTGEPVARLSSVGLDLGAAVRYAREIGGPALRALTLRERARLAGDLAAYLGEHKDALYAAYPTSGQTRADALVDVDGGIMTLGYYGSLARKLPDDEVYVEGKAAGLSKNPAYMSQTVYTSRPGVAVQINAFNFPVWGMLEKLGQQLIAGLPVIVKPAEQTGHLAELCVQAIVDSGILPDGALQLLSGATGTLLDELGAQDVIAFTGSAATAAKLRANPAVVERGATLVTEADSLNATVLGPDITPDTPEFAQFVKGVVTEITSKSGQKCTAIRRTLVPTEHVDALVEALRAALEPVVVGDPREQSTQVGPLVSAAQRRAVGQALAQLSQDADIVIGGPGAPTPEAARHAGDAHGFVAPTVLRARNPRSPRLHEVEAFGPVTTVIGYADLREAADLVALGGGSLVASLVTRSPQVARDLVRAIAPHHGRVLLVNGDTARGGTPHGTVMPQLVHGGPGRAGGGEELAGLRGVLHLMQATSLHGPADLLVGVTGEWNRGASTLTPAGHPFRLGMDELRIGDTLQTASRTITIEDIEAFAHLTGDTFYAHMDEQAAAASPLFDGRVAHGYFVLAAAAGLFVDPDPGPVLANYGLDNLRFVTPVYPGDEIHLRLTCKKKTPREGEGSEEYGEVTWDVEVRNQDDERVASYDLLTINAYRSAPA